MARQAALLVPVDDGGPQPPDPDAGRSVLQQLSALVMLALGGLATALIWQRGATRALVGGVVAGTLVLASAPLVVPAVTAKEPAPSTAVRIRTETADQTIKAEGTGSATVKCPAGSVLVGGGVRAAGAGVNDILTSVSVPTANGWTASATAPQDKSVTLTAVALCTTDVGVTTAPAASVPASLMAGDTARTQARCGDGVPLALGWSGGNAPAVAELPLHDGGTAIAFGTASPATSITNVLCASPGSTAYPVRYESDQVEIGLSQRGKAEATCGAGSQAVGGGYVAAASVGGRVSPVTVISAAPDGDSFAVEVAAADTGSGVLLTAYALCLPVH